MDKVEAYEFARAHGLAVLATVSAQGMPQAALIEFAVTPELEILFDTIDSTRKYANLRHNSRVALVIGWNSAETLQYEGWADEPQGPELDRIKKQYFEGCPNGSRREGWPGLTYFRVRPLWLRLSSYQRPRHVAEMRFDVPAWLQPPKKKRRWLFS